MGHTSEAALAAMLSAARGLITVGSYYYHYKQQDEAHKYQVIELALDEESERVVVVYKALYGEELLWVRSLEDFIAEVEYGGQTTKRFILVD